MILATAIIKGGTGKTTTATALLQAGAFSNKRVLGIDLDPQCNLSMALGRVKSNYNAYDLLEGLPVIECIQTTKQNIDLIQATEELATVKTSTGSIKRLYNYLQPIKEYYDLIVIDTPPQIGELTYNALMASDTVIIPLETDQASLQGLNNLHRITTELLQAKTEVFKNIYVLANRYDKRAKLNNLMLDMIINTAERLNFSFIGTVSQNISIREAQALQKNLFEYAPKSKATIEYMEIYKEIEKEI